MLRNNPSAESKLLAERQAALLNAAQGIGDILVFDTRRRNQNKEVLQVLKQLADLIRDLLALRHRDPQRFEQMILAQRVFNLFRENNEAARFHLAFDPEKSLITFSTLLNQIMRVHEAALEVNNTGLSIEATVHLNWILSELVTEPDNGIFIEQIFRELNRAMQAAAKKADRSAYLAAIDWYGGVVFSSLSEGEKNFRLEYLNLFNTNLLGTVKFIVLDGHTKLFNELLLSLTDGVHVPTYDIGKVWEYSALLMQADNAKYRELVASQRLDIIIKELVDSERQIDSKERLDAWLVKFSEVKSLLAPHLSEDDRQRAEEIEKTIIDCVIALYKHSDLLEVVFRIGAYCLAKNRPDYILALWEAKQPIGSTITWVGNNIVPESLGGILNLYFRPSLLEPDFSLLEGHQDIRSYFSKYFLLSLARLLQGEMVPSVFDFTGWEAPRLSGIVDSLKKLVPLAQKLAEEGDLVASLGFDQSEAKKIFGERLVVLLNELSSAAEKQISAIQRERPISQLKVTEFRKKVVEEYDRIATIRAVLSHFGCINDQTAQPYAGTLPRYGLNQVDAKAAFFERWHVHYVGWGTNYGQSLALSEDTKISDVISEKCSAIAPGSLAVSVSNLGADTIILAAPLAILTAFESDGRYVSHWQSSDVPKLDVVGFRGWFQLGDIRAPVFQFHSRTADKRVLILSKSRLGSLTQFSPLNATDHAEDLVRHLLISVRAFSHEPQIMERALAEAPPWLQKFENDTQRREYAKERVWIEVAERFDFSFHKDFLGYVFDAP